MAETNTCSWQRLTTSGVVGDSGQPIDVSGYSVISGATATNVTFKDGTSTTANAVFQAGPITVSQANVLSMPAQVRFAHGCYVSFDANTTSVTVFYVQALTA